MFDTVRKLANPEVHLEPLHLSTAKYKDTFSRKKDSRNALQCLENIHQLSIWFDKKFYSIYQPPLTLPYPEYNQPTAISIEPNQQIDDRDIQAKVPQMDNQLDIAQSKSTRLSPENAYLRVKNGSQINREIPLNNIYLTIGRNIINQNKVNIDLTDCERGETPTISRNHAVIKWMNDELLICDLNSRNGTSVNGEKLLCPSKNEPSPFMKLEINSTIILGKLEMEIIIK